MSINNKKIIIYLPDEHAFNESIGGIIVQFYFAQLLKNLGQDVYIYNNIRTKNNIFNNYYEGSIDIENTVIIYGETIKGNPLNGKYIIRWILLDISRFDKSHMLSWGKNDLVYYYNSESKFNETNTKIYKMLPILYLNSNFKNNRNNRSGYCHTFRKAGIFHSNIKIIHPEDSFEIQNLNHNELIEIFNKYEYFVSYDPCTFLSEIAALCGCISIIYPIENVNKKEWIKKRAYIDYFSLNENFNLPGISYGNSEDEIEFARNTINNANEEIKDIIKYIANKNINSFINDINNFDKNENTVEANYY
jgi:hypothetical protein